MRGIVDHHKDEGLYQVHSYIYVLALVGFCAKRSDELSSSKRMDRGFSVIGVLG